METGKNRSSILKPQKQRNPLSDLDLMEPAEVDSPVGTKRRSSLRRVSFASSNFVKEFATDPVKNTTVWDTTYEETLNKSDSSHSSDNVVHQMVCESAVEVQTIISDGKPAKINQNFNKSCVTTCNKAIEKIGLMKPYVCAKNDGRKVSINFYEHGGEDIESDSSLCDIDNCENRIIETRTFQPSNDIKNVNIINTERKTNDMAVTHQIIQKEEFHTESTDVNVKGVPDSKCLPQVSPFNAQKMRFTNLFGQSQNLTATYKENIPMQNDSRIRLPNLSHRKLCQSVTKGDGPSGSSVSKMEPFVNKEECNSLKHNKGFSTFNKSSTTVKVNTFVDNDNTAFVQQCFGSNKSIIKNETVLSNNTMELTPPFSGFTSNISENRATLGTTNMECTQNLQSLNKIKRGIKSRTIAADESMEITQEFPVVDNNSCSARNKTIMMNENVEFTQQLPTFNFLAYNVRNIHETLVKGAENKTIIADESMELSRPFPIVDQRDNNGGNKTVAMDESLEFTQQLPTSNFLACNVRDVRESLVKGDKNKTIIADQSMELTRQFPVVDHNTNQELAMDNQKMKKVNTSSALNDSKNMNVSNDAFQQFDTVNNVLPTLCLTQNEDLFTDVNKSNTIELVKTPGSSFHMTFTPFSPGIDDTQHLINYSLTHKELKSDFSKIITGDLNPSFFSSKFMPLSGFSSDAYPVSPETSRNNQTHLESMELDTVKDRDNKTEQEQHNKDCDVFPVSLVMSADSINANQISIEPAELKKNKNCDVFPASLESDLKQMAVSGDKNCEENKKGKPPLLRTCDSNKTNTEICNKENIENIVICKKSMLCNTEEDDINMVKMNENMETSAVGSRIINISQEDLTLSDSVSSVSDSTFSKEAKELIFNITQSININASMKRRTHQLQETYANRALMKQKFDDFMETMTKNAATLTKNSIILGELYDAELKEIRKPFKQHSFEEIVANVNSSADCSLVEPISKNIVTEQDVFFHTDSDLIVDVEKILTLKEKIEEKRKRCKNYWNVLSIEDVKCEFDTLYKTIRLIVQLDKGTGIVNKTDICCNISADSGPTALFVHKIFKDCLTQKNIQSAVGEQYDILTLLDYVYINMQKMLEIHKEFDGFAKRYNLKMDENFRVTFKMVNLHLRSTWCISVDMSDVENITEDSITAYAKVGTINETEIKRFATGCPRGVLFLRSFINNLLGYIELLMKRKNLIKSKPVGTS